MKYYYFNQNNSGGHFHLDDSMVGAHTAVIQANSAEEANEKAEWLGIYFRGVEDGRDCSCCGDRWYKTDEQDSTDEVCLRIWRSKHRVTLAEWLNPPNGKKIRKNMFSFGIGKEWKMVVHPHEGKKQTLVFSNKGKLLKNES